MGGESAIAFSRPTKAATAAIDVAVSSA